MCHFVTLVTSAWTRTALVLPQDHRGGLVAPSRVPVILTQSSCLSLSPSACAPGAEQRPGGSVLEVTVIVATVTKCHALSQGLPALRPTHRPSCWVMIPPCVMHLSCHQQEGSPGGHRSVTDPVPESPGGQEGPLLGPLLYCKRPNKKQHRLVRINQGFVRVPLTCGRSVGGFKERWVP